MNSFQDVFDRQKRYFATGVTRSYAWRIEQLDRIAQELVKQIDGITVAALRQQAEPRAG
jgi:aldehyde dehydrogenase (NAD+)